MNLTAGVSGFGLSVTSPGSDPANGVRIALLSPAAPADARRWMAVQAAGLEATLSLEGLMTATVSNLGLEINRASGPATPAPPALNWTTATGTGTAATGAFAALSVVVAGQPITLTENRLAITGRLTITDLLGLLAGEASFEIVKDVVDVQSAAVTLDDATLLTIGLKDLALTAGVAGFGISITGGQIRVATLAPAPAAPSQPASGWRSRRPA